MLNSKKTNILLAMAGAAALILPGEFMLHLAPCRIDEHRTVDDSVRKR